MNDHEICHQLKHEMLSKSIYSFAWNTLNTIVPDERGEYTERQRQQVHAFYTAYDNDVTTDQR